MSWYDILLRLGLAALCGMLIGSEREHRHRPAGIKTHILVCVGAALVSLIQLHMVDDAIALVQGHPDLAQLVKTDYGRMGAQVISGIGFLGAGTILRNKGTIKGLTTAATLWLTACIGLAVGMGYYWMSGLAILLTMLVLIILHLFQNSIANNRGLKRLEVAMCDKRQAMSFINDYCAARDITIMNMEFMDLGGLETDPPSGSSQTYGYTLRLPRSVSIKELMMSWQMEPPIIAVTLGEAEAP